VERLEGIVGAYLHPIFLKQIQLEKKDTLCAFKTNLESKGELVAVIEVGGCGWI
jgi:hypothetical protein